MRRGADTAGGRAAVDSILHVAVQGSVQLVQMVVGGGWGGVSLDRLHRLRSYIQMHYSHTPTFC